MKLKSILSFMAAAAVLVSCGSNKSESNYTVEAVCNFDYSDAGQLTGDSGVYFQDAFAGAGLLAFLNTASEDKTTFLGGCALVGLSDNTLEEGHVAHELCVFGTGYDESKYYMTVKYGPGMPEHTCQFVQKGYGTLTPKKMFVNNTNQMVTIARYGLPEHDGIAAIPAFQEGDYVKVVIYGYQEANSSFIGTVEFTLAQYDGSLEVCKEWKEIDLTKLGNIDYIDVKMQSNRTDLPLCFCVENLEFSASVNI